MDSKELIRLIRDRYASFQSYEDRGTATEILEVPELGYCQTYSFRTFFVRSTTKLLFEWWIDQKAINQMLVKGRDSVVRLYGSDEIEKLEKLSSDIAMDMVGGLSKSLNNLVVPLLIPHGAKRNTFLDLDPELITVDADDEDPNLFRLWLTDKTAHADTTYWVSKDDLTLRKVQIVQGGLTEFVWKLGLKGLSILLPKEKAEAVLESTKGTVRPILTCIFSDIKYNHSPDTALS